MTVSFSHKFYKHCIIIMSIIGIICLSMSCEKKQEKQVQRVLSEIEVTTTQIVIIDMEGDVSIKDGNDFIDLGEDDIINESDVIKTGMDSFCELQFGETAVVRVQEDSIVAMNSILTEVGNTDITLGLSLGTILCKVEKLVENEKFEVETSGSVCGVRGTRFGIEVKESEDISLFVEEGACALVPLFIAPQTIADKLSGNPELARILNSEIDKNIVVVTAQQEVNVKKSTLVENEKKFEQVNKALTEISQKETITEEDTNIIKNLIKTASKEVLNRTSKVDVVSESHQSELKHIEKIKKKEIKIKTKELNLEEEKKDINILDNKEEKAPLEKEETKVQEEKKENKKEEKVVQKISIHTDPMSAKVYINDEFAGNTPVTISDKKAGNYSIRIEKEGYKSIIKEIELTRGNDQFFNLIMEEEGPQVTTVSIHTNPEKASAYFNGEYLGTTPCKKDNVEFGEYEIMIQLRGYSSITQTIIVDKKDQKSIFTLKPENMEVAVLTDVLDLLGAPDNYSPEQIEEFRGMKSHVESIDFIYFGRFYLEIIDLHLASILFTGDIKDFVFYTEVGIHSTRAQIEAYLGEPSSILAEGKLLRYSKKGVTIEIDTQGLANSFRLYKMDPLLTLESLDSTTTDIAEFLSKLKKFPVHFGIKE
ncbi:MAG: PEGA domain-containing protein [Spirochaetales bacterium]|nr:PEGA domain-containing protein [Spirochaetales bacterium]